MSLFFFFNDTATPEIYTLSLHDALPIFPDQIERHAMLFELVNRLPEAQFRVIHMRSEEHTSELQSLRHLVCRLLLEKKKKRKQHSTDKQRERAQLCNAQQLT